MSNISGYGVGPKLLRPVRKRSGVGVTAELDGRMVMFAACIALTFILAGPITGSWRCSSNHVTKPLQQSSTASEGPTRYDLPERLAPAAPIAVVRPRLAKFREEPRYSAEEWVLAI